MPRLRRLSGREVIAILERFGFGVIRIKGSHHRLQRVVEGKSQYVTVPVHGNRPLSTGPLHDIYCEACEHIPEDELRPYFYT